MSKEDFKEITMKEHFIIMILITLFVITSLGYLTWRYLI